MTEKRYKMINTNLKDKDRVYYNIQRNDGFNVCQVFGKHTAREIVDELNALHEENQKLLTLSNMKKGALVEAVKDLTKENEQLKQQIADNGVRIDFLSVENKHMYEVINENEQFKKEKEYWKQVASQYSNELNAFKHCKKYKTECKDIYWSSD